MSEVTALPCTGATAEPAIAPPPPVATKPSGFAVCEHIKDNGFRCGSPALRARHFCYFHSRAHRPVGRFGQRNYRSPIPETVESLQVAMAHVMQALASGDITPKHANSMLYSISLATNLLRNRKSLTQAEQAGMVTELPSSMIEVLTPVEPDDYDGADQPGDSEPPLPSYRVYSSPQAQPPQPAYRVPAPPQPEPSPQPANNPAISPERFDELCSRLMTYDQYCSAVSRLRSGKSSPDYHTAYEKIAAHVQADRELAGLGLTPESDPRLSSYLFPLGLRAAMPLT